MEFTFTFGIVDCCFFCIVFTLAVWGVAYDMYESVKKRYPDGFALKRFFRFCVYLSPFAAICLFVQYLSMKLAG